MMKDLTRRAFLRMSAAMAAAGVFAWQGEVKADDRPVIGVDPATSGSDETVVFSDLDEISRVREQNPFTPYFLPPGASWGWWNDEGRYVGPQSSEKDEADND